MGDNSTGMTRMGEPKQVIVVRKDLNMRRGKESAQIAHGSMKVFFDRMGEQYYQHDDGSGEGWSDWVCSMTPEMIAWKQGIFTKVVVYVCSETELLELHFRAADAGIPCALIEDCGRTEFGGVKPATCLAIGPDLPERIDPITGHLPLR